MAKNSGISKLERNSKKKVDFKTVKEVIKKDNLDTNLIRIFYENLTKKEMEDLIKKQGADKVSEGKALAEYPVNKEPLHSKKATAILYLGAD